MKNNITNALSRASSKFIFGLLCLSLVVAVACGDSDDDIEAFKRFVCAIAALDTSSFLIGGDDGFSAYSTDMGTSFTEDSPGNGTAFTDSEWNLGTIWTTAKGGFLFNKLSLAATYVNVDSGTTEDLNDIDFTPSGNIGIAVGNNGTMTRTADAGSSWMPMTLGTTDFKGIDCPTDSVCWTVGASNLVYKTSDQGISWDMVDIGLGVNFDLYGVSAEGSEKATVVGDKGFIARTLDGGDSWTQIQSGTERDLRGLVMYGDGRGLLVGDRFASRTLDDGASWELIPALVELGVLFKKIVFALQGGTIFIAGTEGTILQTDDLGENFMLHPVVVGDLVDLEDQSAEVDSELTSGGGSIDSGDQVVDATDESVPDVIDGLDEQITAGAGGASAPGFVVTNDDFSFSHDVGSTECPQKIGEFDITNDGGETLQITIAANGGSPLTSNPSTVTLEAGQTVTVELFFDCSQTTSFDGGLSITGVGSSDTVSANVRVVGEIN